MQSSLQAHCSINKSAKFIHIYHFCAKKQTYLCKSQTWNRLRMKLIWPISVYHPSIDLCSYEFLHITTKVNLLCILLFSTFLFMIICLNIAFIVSKLLPQLSISANNIRCAVFETKQRHLFTWGTKKDPMLIPVGLCRSLSVAGNKYY